MTGIFSFNSTARAITHSARGLNQRARDGQLQSLACRRLASAGPGLAHGRVPSRRWAIEQRVVAAGIVLSIFVLSACKSESKVTFPTAGSRSTSVSLVTNDPDSGLVTSTNETWNKAPKIWAQPPDTIRAGTAYSYAPTAIDPDSDPLRYSVTNLPDWASFDPSTGELSGRPTDADLGAHTGIKISVSDGRGGTASTVSFGIWVVASATGAATLNWYPPTERSDGSPLTNLSGYKIYWSLNPDNFVNSFTIDNPGITSYMISGLTSGTWYFTMTSFDSDGIESLRSHVVSKFFD